MEDEKLKNLKRREIMFGLPDPSIWLAYLLCIGSTILCIVYGVINWNKDDSEDKED